MKKIVLLLGIMVMVFLLEGQGAFAETKPPQPTDGVPQEVELPVDITIDIIRGEEDILDSTRIEIDMKNSKSGREIHLVVPRIEGDENQGTEEHSVDEHSVVNSTPAQTGVPPEPDARPVDLDLPHTEHPGTPVAGIPELGVPDNAPPEFDPPAASPPVDVSVVDVPRPDLDVSGEMVPDIDMPAAVPPDFDTPVATVPDMDFHKGRPSDVPAHGGQK